MAEPQEALRETKASGPLTGRLGEERIAIVLSAGYFGFFAHAGFMLAIEDLKLEYQAIAGSSAGAIVAALHASGLPASEIKRVLVGVRKRDFWDSTGISSAVRAVLRKGRGWTGLLKGDRFERLIESHLRVKTFEECPRSLYLTAFNLTKGDDETFTSGPIAEKVRASCSYPFLMTPKSIDGQLYWDGGFLAKVPLERMLEAEKPDCIIIHYLRSRNGLDDFARRNWSAAALLESALSSARGEIERRRLEALGQIGEKLVWVVPDVPAVGPRDLDRGTRAVEAAYRHALDSLSRLRSGD